MKLHFLFLLFGIALLNVSCRQYKKPDQKSQLYTQWAKDVGPSNDHIRYPRPQMVRQVWLNLNSLWDYAIRPDDNRKPSKYDGKILVPFPVESALSGVERSVGPDSVLWYHRTFTIDPNWKNDRILLHFGAVDWKTTVWVNGEKVGTHQGGYDPFTFDISNVLKQSGRQNLLVQVWDPTNEGYQPVGKQTIHPHGIWYTSTTGIWQTAWIEPVPEVSINRLKMKPDIDHNLLHLSVETRGNASEDSVRVTALDGFKTVSSIEAPADQEISLSVPDAKLWSPESPFLYNLEVALLSNGKVIDHVTSYFGMRSIGIGKGPDGFTRILLNHKPVFEFGPLDQGFWPDGIYTAPDDAALMNDIEVMKKLGFNMVRKHVKVEPARYYYWCDKLGLLVWQDMPSGDMKNKHASKEASEDYYAELTAMIHNLYNHPGIVMWVPFNEGWGQFNTKNVVAYIQKMDSTRLVDDASGWTDEGVGSVHDMHKYPGPGVPDTESNRAAVLGEFGGLGLPLAGHTWQKEKNWSYHGYKNRQDLTTAYKELVSKLKPLILEKGLSAAVYTQLTDVEIEVNGLMTYDRKIIKEDTSIIAPLNRSIVRTLK